MIHFSFSGLRARLVILALLAVTPAILLILYSGWEGRRAAWSEAQSRADLAASLLAAHPNQLDNPAWLNRVISILALPAGTEYLRIDPTGVSIYQPDSGEWGPASPQAASLARPFEPGTKANSTPASESEYIYAFSPLDPQDFGSGGIGVGVPEDIMLASAGRVLTRNIVAAIIVLILALFAAWYGGEILLLRDVRPLLAATQRLEAGDWSARTGLPSGQDELRQLSHSFDQMASVLEQRERERDRSEREVKRQSRDLAALNTAVAEIGGSLEIPVIISNLARELADRLDVPGGVIFFHDELDNTLNLEAAWEVPSAVLAPLKRFPAEIYHYHQVARQREACLYDDFRKLEPYAASGLAAARPGWQWYLCVPLIAKGELQGILDLFFLNPPSINPDQVMLFTSLGRQVGVIIQNARLFAQVRSGRQRLQMLSHQLLDIQESERRHIARELHDEIGQVLTAVKVNLQTMQRLSDPTLLQHNLAESIAITERALKQVRDLSLDLRPSLLDDLGVVAALRWYIDRQGQRAGFQTEFSASPPDLRLSPELETVIFRVVQEALTNVVRHALASRVQVALSRGPNRLRLTIRDDGIGFDVDAVRGRIPSDASLGLMGMQERVQLIDGRFYIYSNLESGTLITAEFPLENQ